MINVFDPADADAAERLTRLALQGEAGVLRVGFGVAPSWPEVCRKSSCAFAAATRQSTCRSRTCPDDRSSLLLQQFARRRQVHAAEPPNQERAAEAFFQTLHLFA